MPRLFVAVETPQEIRTAIARVIEGLKGSGAEVRWEEPEKLHITLKFLGNTEEERVPRIIAALEDVAQKVEPFDIQYASLGTFPPKGQPRVLWVGVRQGEQSLKMLAAAVETAMGELGFEPEERAFHPHVTIGRVKGGRNMHDLLRRMESITFESQPTHVTHISLVKSELRPSGSVYTTVRACPFHTGGTATQEGRRLSDTVR